MSTRITIIGGGSWGTALAIAQAKKGNNVTLWVRSSEQLEEIQNHKTNNKYLPNVKIPTEISVKKSLEEAIHGSEIIVMAVPTSSFREVLKSVNLTKEQIIVNVAKGIEIDSLKRISQISSELHPNNRFAVLSGPSHAEEVAIDLPTTLVAASEDKQTAEFVQDIFNTNTLRIYTNPDVIGVELGGALKNIIALGAGITDGLGFGDNTKAALITRGIHEMIKLGIALGADSETFSGLSGVGDLIVTCTSMHSRNRRAGILIGKGLKLKEVLKEVGMEVEGAKTVVAAYRLSQKHKIEMPITNEIFKVLYEDADVLDSVQNLMGRSKKHEIEIVAKRSWT